MAIDTLADMEELFEGIPQDRVSVSLTINHPAIVMLSMFLSVAEGRGIPLVRPPGHGARTIR